MFKWKQLEISCFTLHNSVQKEEIDLPLDSSNIIDLRLLLPILYSIHSISRSH